jgi:hypothetical protein
MYKKYISQLSQIIGSRYEYVQMKIWNIQDYSKCFETFDDPSLKVKGQAPHLVPGKAVIG